ncbi:MAG: tRNA lysidine(34) synthetase TilS [Labilithrix sp.]|nr:tRNA lysidine(34) synthetase TilS [Labilithrix sp.]
MKPTLLTIAKRALTPPRGEAKLERGSTVLVAVSGGPDSMALLHVLARLAGSLGLDVRAHGVDHGLRNEAAAELDLAEALADRVGVPFARTRLRVKPGANLQARARTARYAALARAARAAGAKTIATAHHADDRAETVLMRLIRGAGPRGLAVLPARAPLPEHEGLELVRPFIRASREAVRAHLERHDIPFASDPSNEDPRFLRARVRRELMPLLLALSPAIVENLTALADQLALAAVTGDEGDETQRGGDAYRVLSRATQEALADLARSRSPTARVWLPGGLVAIAAEEPGQSGKTAGKASHKAPRRRPRQAARKGEWGKST